MRYPLNLPAKYRRYWREPWHPKAARSPGFRRWLARHGYLTPHFRLTEASCTDGSRLPMRFRRRARKHAFRLERLRHALGGSSIRPLSWYRSPSYNARIGGARYSQHMNGWATDFSRQEVERHGRARFMAAAQTIFKNDGIGVYPAGSVHLDSRGWYARWNSWGR
jgi:hypothetical protein